MPVFEAWSAPLRDLGVTLVTLRSRCAGDCRPFEQAGIPSPGVIQDPLEYDTRTHHTNSDTYDRLVPVDLRQAAVVMATFLYNTAMRDQLLPALAREDVMIAGPHMPFPALGRLRKDGNGYIWAPVVFTDQWVDR